MQRLIKNISYDSKLFNTMVECIKKKQICFNFLFDNVVKGLDLFGFTFIFTK